MIEKTTHVPILVRDQDKADNIEAHPLLLQ